MSEERTMAQLLEAKKASNAKKSLEEIQRERGEMDKQQRFGYFTIPYPATCGDRAYSQNKSFEHHRVEGRKVITEARGIYTSPGKRGKTEDVYFHRVDPLTDKQIADIKLARDIDHAKLMQKVKDEREGKNKGKVIFKPGGPQELLGFYKDTKFEPKGSIYLQKNRFRFIGPDRKIITENRGIFTHPTRTGILPSDLFAVYETDGKQLEKERIRRLQDENEILKARKAKQSKENYKKPFSPASLMKCDSFSPDSETYGIDPKSHEDGLKRFRYFKAHGTPKYVKTSPPDGAAKHDKPFAPAKKCTTGRESLFNDDLYKLPKLPPLVKMPLKMRLELEKKNKKETFRYNRLQDHTNFSPAISSFNSNLKSDFPSVRF